MLKRVSLAVVGTLALLALSFTCGFNLREARAADWSKFWAAIQMMPERLEMLSPPTDEDFAKLPPLEAYWGVLTRLTSDYYGPKPDQRQLTYSAIRGMLKGLNDPFTRFLDPDEYRKMREENEGNFVGIGAQLDVNKNKQVYIKEPLPDSPAIRAGLKSGDVILKVDDRPISGMLIEDVVKIIRGQENTKVKITVHRPSIKKTLSFTIVRKLVQYRIVQYRMQDKEAKIGYVRLWQFNEHSDQQFGDALTKLGKMGMRGMILDLRANPGGLLQAARDIGSRLIESGPVVIIQERGGQKSPLTVDESKHDHARVPLVVLIDNHSASASEIVAGAIRDNKAGTLVGVTTYGKGVVQTIVPLRDGSAVSITTAKWLTPSGSEINKLGVKPDVVVKAPEEGFDSTNPSKDPQLKKGLEILREKLRSAAPQALRTGTAHARPI